MLDKYVNSKEKLALNDFRRAFYERSCCDWCEYHDIQIDGPYTLHGSIWSVEEVNIRFINNSRDTVDLCWVDFQGNLVRYLKLGSREVVKLTSFTGHCWIARFIRNGAAAQFLPGCTEVFVITRPYPHTAVVFIIQKVPTLFEAAVEHIGELFHENQYALHRLPVPELVKFDIYFYIRRKQIYQTALFVLPFQRNFLRRNRNNVARLREPLEVDEQLAEIFANGQIDLCLQTVSDLSVECSDFEINEIFLTYLKKEFVVMGFSTVYNYAKKWIGFLLQNTSVGIRSCVIWSKIKECVKSAHFNLCTVLVMSSLDLDCAEHMQSLENSFSDLEENDDFSFNLRKQFLVLLEANLGIFLSRCQPTQSKLLLNILITFHLENNDLHLLMQSIFRYSGLADTCSYKILQPFFRCLLLNLSLFIDENSQQKGNIGIWIKKIVVEILSMSNKSYEDELKSWKMIMSEFIIAPHHMLLSDNKRFCQIIQLICGKKFPLKTLPISLRVTLFCVLISLIPYISSEMFEIAVEIKEFLLNSCNHGTLALKCDVILKAALQRALVEEQYYFLKPLCDTFSEIHYEINTEENSILRIRAEELCKTLCKHPERLIEFGIISEQLSQLLRTSILWMVRRGKLERIVSWKYVRYFELYDDTTVNDIISVASVDMLKSLLYSSWHDLHASKKFTLYFALAKHQNEDKRKLLSTVLKDILEVTVDIAAGADYLIVIDFLRHILPIVTGNAYERDFTSFALALLAANYESLSSDFIALRSAVSLLLDCLRFGAHSVINDQCSFYMSLFVYVGRAVQKYVNNASEVNPQLIRHLSYGLAKVAHEMVKHERSFSRVAPFIISECLEDTKYLSLALFRIFSICDRHSIALLTTNLPPLQKTRFANLSLQFKKIKMVV
ncbi:unnamed protein product [Onchocerca ochengi]|uniref:VHL domain-containing protein n=1 Tax=Onchocerca ochengi TaxID=42157 RepID=A0A182E6D0_ONCOC|nr:unnamed protein product [Onchocerca ochengi]